MSESNNNSYFIVSDVNTASRVVHDLVNNQVSRKNIGVVGDKEALKVADLPEVDLTEATDVVDAAKRGAVIGSATGLLAGIAMTAIPPAGVAIGGSALVAMAAGGAAMGGWSASMIGVSEKSEEIDRFESAINDGDILILADITQGDNEALLKKIADNNAIPLDHFGTLH